MEGALFVVNPNAASGRAARVWEWLQGKHPALRHAAVVRCSDPRSATERMRAALSPAVRRLIVLGGDGTLHHAINLLLDEGVGETCSIGLIPVGTGSDLARGLRLEKRPERALQAALESPPRPMDLLRLEAGGRAQHLINVASLGLSAHVVSRVNALPRRNAFTFLNASLRALFGENPLCLRITLDGQLWREGSFYLAVVANGSCFAKGMRIAPDADPHDGLAEVVAIEAVARARVLPWLPTAYFGKHLAAPFVHSRRAKMIELDTAGAHPLFEGDGELALPAPGRIRVVSGALRFCGAR
ncbi:MAG: diacylglycerol kinase family lipid kinase [Gammaproteobacteria bacterium]